MVVEGRLGDGGSGPPSPRHAASPRPPQTTSARSPPTRRWGDLLPLPLPRRPAPPQSAVSSAYTRTARRRHQRELSDWHDSCESVLALNRCAGYLESQMPLHLETKPQHRALCLIKSLHQRRLWPAGKHLDPRASLRKTLRLPSSHYSSEEGTGTLAPYEPGAVSLPAGSSRACQMADVVDDAVADLVSDLRAILKSPEEIADLYDDMSTFQDVTMIPVSMTVKPGLVSLRSFLIAV